MSGAPLPLLGTFHEFSIDSADVRAALECYERFGLVQATTTDTWRHPYGVLGAGGVYLGLHRRTGPSPVLTFVRPGVADCLPGLRSAGVQPTLVETGEEMFNRIGFDDPCGQSVAIIEARTFSPLPAGSGEVLGDFSWVSLPAADLTAARVFWEALGFVAAEESDLPYPHLPLTSDLLNLSFHGPRLYERPFLVFHCTDLPGRVAALTARGASFAARPPRGMSTAGTAWLEGPDGTALLLAAA
ncbi:MAG: hypothetical protein JSR67_08125 [Proteobacteria bacterium]|nr:hypothetical protein [Pseudomonadota bacterium]